MEAMLKKLLAVSALALFTFASYVAAVELNPAHPDTYVVKKGDTLWGIAGRFLKSPWLWPEIWQANPQVENPHLIYPGDVLSLVYLGNGQNRPALDLRRGPQIRREELPIPAVPLAEVESFLRDVTIIDQDTYKSAPYVLGVEEGHLLGSRDQVVYVRGGEFEPGQLVSFFRPTQRYSAYTSKKGQKVFRDDWTAERGVSPDNLIFPWAYRMTGKSHYDLLGWEVLKSGYGRVTRFDGDVATVLLADDGREVRKGDLLLPYNPFPYDLAFFPHAPDNVLEHARLMAVTDRNVYGGAYDVVAISAGSADGVANGQVYSVWNPGELTADNIKHKQALSANLKRNKVQLPDEFAGHVMIFRTFEKVSYGLVMNGIRPAKVGDKLKAPDRI